MYVATLLTDPARRGLDPALVENLRNAWGGGDAVWLAPDEAAEFALGEVPGNRWEVWAEVQTLGVDLVVLPAEGRAKRMLLADMDSTMIRQECIDELAEEAGHPEKEPMHWLGAWPPRLKSLSERRKVVENLELLLEKAS